MPARPGADRPAARGNDGDSGGSERRERRQVTAERSPVKRFLEGAAVRRHRAVRGVVGGDVPVVHLTPAARAARREQRRVGAGRRDAAIGAALAGVGVRTSSSGSRARARADTPGPNRGRAVGEVVHVVPEVPARGEPAAQRALKSSLLRSKTPSPLPSPLQNSVLIH